MIEWGLADCSLLTKQSASLITGITVNKIFENDGYLVVRDFLSTEAISILQSYFLMRYDVIRSSGEFTPETSILDAGDSYTLYSDTLAEAMLLQYGPKLARVLEADILPTYTCARIYERDGRLVPHIDRGACEISVTCPVIKSDSSPSVIYIGDVQYDGSIHDRTFYDSPDQIANLNYVARVELLPGDALLYKGNKHFHWRDPLDADYLIQFFMHAVLKDGAYSDLIYDKRPFLGYKPGIYLTRSINVTHY